MKGIGVSMTRIRTVDITPMKQRVTRSPKQEATGGAILSGIEYQVAVQNHQGQRTRVPTKPPAENDQRAHERTEDYAGEACSRHRCRCYHDEA